MLGFPIGSAPISALPLPPPRILTSTVTEAGDSLVSSMGTVLSVSLTVSEQPDTMLSSLATGGIVVPLAKVRTSAGTTFSVCASMPATYDVAGFGALSYTDVAEVVDIGSFGRKYNLVTFSPLGDRRITKRKGSYTNGSIALKVGASVTDNGQLTMQNGCESDSSYSFKVVTQSGSTYYFTGQIMSWILEIGSVDQIMSASCEIEIDNDIVRALLVA